MNNTLLIIGHTLPEPSTTAAGGRMLQLIELFQEAGYEITFASTAKVSERSLDLKALGISSELITLNDPSFDRFMARLEPDIVIFDRFMTEEQFGWRVAEQCPEALRVLDTEDLHFLRKARQKAVMEGHAVEEAYLYTETAKRELASIFRCDLSLIISEVEIELLTNQFGISEDILCYLPFLVNPPSEEEKELLPGFSDRHDFISIGNFQHAPNADALLQLKQEIWPLIREKLPDTSIRIYGAYASENMLKLHDESRGFLIEGWAEDAHHVIKSARLCLAPLRFGAGLKGKIIDAVFCGTPVVTTWIGAEGMFGNLAVPGAIENSPEAFAETAVSLYKQRDRWLEAQANGFTIIEERFDRADFSEESMERLQQVQNDLIAHRNRNFMGQIIQHQSLQATKYMSKWIEEKNSLSPKSRSEK